MLQFLQNNAGTLIVGFVVLAVIAAIIIKKVMDKIHSKSTGCGCGCSGCSNSEHCSGESPSPGS